MVSVYYRRRVNRRWRKRGICRGAANRRRTIGGQGGATPLDRCRAGAGRVAAGAAPGERADAEVATKAGGGAQRRCRGGSTPRGAGAAAAGAPAGGDRGGARRTASAAATVEEDPRAPRLPRRHAAPATPRPPLRHALGCRRRPARRAALEPEQAAPADRRARRAPSGDQRVDGGIRGRRRARRSVRAARPVARRRRRVAGHRPADRPGGGVPRPLSRGAGAPRLPRVSDLVHRRAGGGAGAARPPPRHADRASRGGAERGAAARAQPGSGRPVQRSRARRPGAPARRLRATR